MDLQLHDLHLILSATARRGKLFAAGGQLLFEFEARNRTVADGQFGRWGNCPSGRYLLTQPVPKDMPPFGKWFVPMVDFDGNTTMADHHRSGIGLHGGGSGLADPFAPRQGFVVTHGCWRLQNEDLEHFVSILRAAQGAGGKAYATVLPWMPSEMPETEPDILIPEDQLDPEE